MKVILVSGKAQHGKDTTAGFLYEKLTADGNRVIITHYADLLKYICKEYFGWDGNKDEHGREILQHVGTDVIRKQQPSFWVDFIISLLTLFKEEWDYVIIPDCRFPNEVNRMKDTFDTIHLRVKRTNFISPLTEEQQMHPSETALDDFKPDFWVVNDSDKESLQRKVNLWIKDILY